MPNKPASDQSSSETYDPTWRLTGGGDDDSETLRESFRRLVKRAEVASGGRLTGAEAVDAWLNRLHKFYAGRRRKYALDHWHLKDVLKASAEYCEELATHVNEARDSGTEGIWTALKQRFGELPNPEPHLSAIRRGETCLHLDHKFRYWLYDHSHKPLADPKAELDYWGAYVRRGYHVVIANCCERSGPIWAKRHEKLKRAIRGLSSDLAVLQASYVISRGLRGEEAIQAFQNESAELLQEVTSEWRSSCERLAVMFEDDTEQVKNLAKPFDDIRNDLHLAAGGSSGAGMISAQPAAAGATGPGGTDPARDETCEVSHQPLEMSRGDQPELGAESASEAPPPASDTNGNEAVADTESTAERTGGVSAEPATLADLGGQAKVHRSVTGRNIDRLRKECGWSFDALAEKTKLDKKLILGHVNKGKGTHPDTLKTYATAFTKGLNRHVTVAELEGNTTEIPLKSPQATTDL